MLYPNVRDIFYAYLNNIFMLYYFCACGIEKTAMFFCVKKKEHAMQLQVFCGGLLDG
jgi:hypothetical protein